MEKDFIPRYGEYTEYEIGLIKDRTRNLKDLYKNFKQKSLSEGTTDVGFTLCVPEFLKIPLLYVNDLKEYKTFHDASGGTDSYKRAAYIARYVATIRPIIIRNDPSVPENLLNVNAQFALFVFLTFAGYDPDKFSKSGFNKISNELLYIFEFRDPQKELLVVIARMLGRNAAD